MNKYFDEPIIEAYIYETSMILESLEQIMIQSEIVDSFTKESIDEIFRHMHTIKGSASMLMYNNIGGLAHVIEDFFFMIRKNESMTYDFSKLVDLVLESIDFFKLELLKVKNSEPVDGDHTIILNEINAFIDNVKGIDTHIEEKRPQKQQQFYIRPSAHKKDMNHFKALIKFEEGCEMENIRAYTIVQNVTEISETSYYWPNNILEDESSASIIKKDGFQIVINSKKSLDEVQTFYESTIYLSSVKVDSITSDEFSALALDYKAESRNDEIKIPKVSKQYKEGVTKTKDNSPGQAMISVHLDKLNSLMDLVGELVIAEAMVTQNPIVKSHEIESFEKASRQLRKISGDIQDMVMEIRMIPLSTSFLKMHRIVRDMNKKLNKNVILEVVGEETEMDKIIIEKISDPLMHIIRNALDHGIEDELIREEKGKNPQGKIVLEAKNSGSDVLIIVRDDGKGLNVKKIYDKAFANGLIEEEFSELTEREIFNLILKPGFSTNETVTEYSGRGVGMDVVNRNISEVGGSVIVSSEEGKGTQITLKIPLTLAIIEGMNIKVGNSRFTLPIVSIQESFRPEENAVFEDTNGSEMIMVRGECFPVLRLHSYYEIETDVKSADKGILIMVEEDERSCCIFADELLGQQQVVVKALPNYIKNFKNANGLSGCTLLGDGNISLILDVGDLNKSIIRGSR